MSKTNESSWIPSLCLISLLHYGQFPKQLHLLHHMGEAHHFSTLLYERRNDGLPCRYYGAVHAEIDFTWVAFIWPII